MTLPTEKWNRTLTAVLGLIFVSVICTGNGLVLVTIYKKATLHSVTNYFLAVLAVGDLFVGVVALPMWITRSLLGISDEEHPLSIWVDSVYVLSVASSTYNLCSLSLERYVGVVLPLRYGAIVTNSRCLITAVSVWIISTCVASLRFLLDEDTFWIAAISTVFFVPAVAISYCYFNILRESSRQMRVIAEQQRPRSLSGLADRIKNKKAAITVAIIIAIFFVTSLPALAFSLTEIITSGSATCEQKTRLESWGTWALFSAYVNAAVNPWIYTMRKRDFRLALKIIVLRREVESVEESAF